MTNYTSTVKAFILAHSKLSCLGMRALFSLLVEMEGLIF